MTSMEYGNGATVHYAYDTLGRTSRVWYIYGNGSETAGVTYAYSPEGYLTEVTDLDNATRERYVYDTEGRIKRVSFDDLITVSGEECFELRYTVSYHYDELGRVIGRDYETVRSDGTKRRTESYTYDSAGRLLSYDADTVFSGETVSYLYGANESLQSILHGNRPVFRRSVVTPSIKLETITTKYRPNENLIVLVGTVSTVVLGYLIGGVSVAIRAY